MYFTISLLQDLIAYATSKDLSIDQLKTSDGNDRYVGFEEMANLISDLVQITKDENLGIHIGELFSLKATVPVDGIILNSKTLEESLNNAIEYSKLISDALECSLNMTDSFYSIQYDENPNWKIYNETVRKQILDMALLSNVKSLAAYTNHHYYPARIHFMYKKPKFINEYYRLFNCSLFFNQTSTQIFYDRRILRKHNKNIKAGLLENLKKKVDDEIDNLRIENSFIYDLKKCILNAMPTRLKGTEAAKLLNTSTRTFQRRLTQLQTNFKSIEHELLLKLAKTYLEENVKTIDEIAYLLGFSESSSFIRFFKSNLHLTPKAYQRNSS